MKQRRLKREHGRILSVETKVRGSALSDDTAAAATSLTVDDAADFDEDGGWLTINGQVVAYTACDDEAGVITLAEGLTDAAEGGDQVAVWSTLYAEVVDYQEAEVVLDGVYDNPEPVVAEVGEGVGELPTGDRGEPGESCTLVNVSTDDDGDEWEIVGVGGRPKKSSGVLFHNHNHAATGPGSQEIVLPHIPIDNSEHVYWRPGGGAGVYQGASQWTRDRNTITLSDDNSLLLDGDVVTVEYAYRAGVVTSEIVDLPSVTTLLVTGEVFGETTSAGTPTIVGSTPQWSDDSDASYASLTSHRENLLSTVNAAHARLAPVTLGITSFTVKARIRLKGSAPLQYPRVYLKDHWDASSPECYQNVAGGGAIPTGSPDWIELELTPVNEGAPYFLNSLSLDDLDVRVQAPYPPSSPFTDYTTEVYEVEIVVTET